MEPILHSEEVFYFLSVTEETTLLEGDIVFCKVDNELLLHKITAINEDKIQIGNNKGKINGWIIREHIFGRSVVFKIEIIGNSRPFKAWITDLVNWEENAFKNYGSEQRLLGNLMVLTKYINTLRLADGWILTNLAFEGSRVNQFTVVGRVTHEEIEEMKKQMERYVKIYTYMSESV